MRETMKVMLWSAMLICTALLGGCAKSADVEALDKRVTALENQMANVVTEVGLAKTAADEAAQKAAAAEAAAQHTVVLVDEINAKLDKIIKQSN